MDRTWHNGIKLDKTRINPSEKSTDDKDWYIVEPICTRFTTEQKNWQPPGHHFLSLPSVPTHLLTYMCELNTHTVYTWIMLYLGQAYILAIAFSHFDPSH